MKGSVYEPLDSAFVKHVAQRFTHATKQALDEGRGRDALRLLGNQPEAFSVVVQMPLARADRTLDDGLQSLLTPETATSWTQY